MGSGVNGRRVAVIGGGWAGIAAAVELTAAGAAVTLFEAGRVLGGRARAVEIAGRRLDNGQHILLGSYRDTLALIRQVGADPDRLLARHPLQIVDNAGFRLALPRWPAPLNLAWGLLTARGVGWREKLRTARWMQGLKRREFRLSGDRSVAEWLDTAGQTGRLRHHLWEPLCLAALNTPAREASAQLFTNVLRDSLGSARRADTDLLLPRSDFGRLLAEPAGDWLLAHGATLRCRTRVRTLHAGIEAVTIDGEHYAAAIIATAPQHVDRLWPVLAENLEYQPIATVYLQYPPTIHLPFPLLGLRGPYGQWVVDRGNGLLACVLSGHGAWEEIDDDTLAQRLAEELDLGTQPGWQQVIREKRATFSARPNLPRPPTTLAPHLFLAGDHSWADYPATLEGAVRSGRRAARLVLAAK
ncbi:hydroxysqualene dehydroxylase HpnE [Azonexus sp.]|uniref:hydroxysqualene dehydroxylase HpnE n=1 Tax=Azonexus sp. TaxID=1872668 RepID=UPI00283AAFA3|nr:hydroxysqualene dehydroxylase HpnE [Azonexus sp.]